MNITADTVKQLRERTGAGMMECKKALVETRGDLDAAARLCRRFGLILIEDAAESLGSSWRGRHTGLHGRFGVRWRDQHAGVHELLHLRGRWDEADKVVEAALAVKDKHLLIVCPVHAAVYKKAGWTKQAIRDYL